MDSAPATSDTSAPATSSTVTFGRDLAHRMNPQVTVIRRSIVQPGFIARRSQAFGSYVGQSQVSRWSIGAGMQRGSLSIRPPIDYWPWATAEEPTPATVPQYERSLPRMQQLRRRSDGQPGAMAKAMKPEPIDIRAIGRPAAGPQRQAPVDKFTALKDMLQRTGRMSFADTDAAASDASASSASSPFSRAIDQGSRAPAPPADGSVRRPAGSPTPPRSSSTPGSSMPTTAPARAATAADAAATPLTRAEASTTLQRSMSPQTPASPRHATPTQASTRGPRPLPPVIAPRLGTRTAQDAGGADDVVDANDLAARIEASRAHRAAPPTAIVRDGQAPADRSATAPSAAAAHSPLGPTDARSAPPTGGLSSDAPVAPLGVVRRTMFERTHADGVLPVTRAAERQAIIAAATRTPGQPLTGNAPVQRTIAGTPSTSAVDRRAASLPGAPPRADATGGPEVEAPTTLRTPSTPAAPTIDSAASTPSSPSTSSDAAEFTVRPPAQGAQPASESRATPAGSQVVLPGADDGPLRADRTNDQRGRHRPSTPPSAPTSAPPGATLSAASGDVLLRRSLSDAAAPSAVQSPPTAQSAPTVQFPPTAQSTPPVRSAPTVQSTSSVQAFSTAQSPDSTTGSPGSDLATANPRASAPRFPGLVADATVAPLFSPSPLTTGDSSSRAFSALDASRAGSTPTSAVAAATTPAVVRRSVDNLERSPATPQRPDGGSDGRHTERSAPRPTPSERPMRPTPDRFLDVLQATPAPAVQRLPQRFATLARAVTGGTDVVVRHDSAARAALAAVGKRAATIGNTIVLPERPGAGTDIGVLAHELTHVAHPSPVPRFFADDHDSAEERQADAVAQLIRRSPALRSPSSTDLPAPPIATSQLAARSTSNAPVLGAHRQAGIVQQLTPPPPRLSAPSVAPPARAGGGMGVARKISSAGRPTSNSNSSSSSGAVRRSTISSGSGSGSGSRPSTTSQSTSAPASSSGQQGVVRRSTAASAMAGDSVIRRALATGSVDEAPAQQQQTTPLHDLIENLRSTGGVVDFVDWLVEQVEDRVVAEIQRRGGRYREDF